MRIRAIDISDETADILRRGVWDGTVFRLAEGQLAKRPGSLAGEGPANSPAAFSAGGAGEVGIMKFGEEEREVLIEALEGLMDKLEPKMRPNDPRVASDPSAGRSFHVAGLLVDRIRRGL